MAAKRRDDLEADMRQLIAVHTLRRICFALADYCYGEAAAHPAENDHWNLLGRIFAVAEAGCRNGNGHG